MALMPNSKFDNSVGFKIKIFPNPTKFTVEKNLLNSRKLQIIVLINQSTSSPLSKCQYRL